MASKTFMELVKDPAFAQELYASMCNMPWRKYTSEHSDEEYEDMEGFMDVGYIVEDSWTASWRGAGGIVADLRNCTDGVSECYMDYYCTGNEGEVSVAVEEELEKLGWYPVPYLD